MFITKLPQPNISWYGRRDDGTNIYILNDDFEYSWCAPDGYRRKIFVEKGYLTDLASVPRIAWTFTGITPSGPMIAPAIPHDLICQFEGDLPKGSYFIFKDGIWIDISDEHWTRKQGDKLFGRIMRESGVTKLKRRAAYLAVRGYGMLFGW